MTYLNDGTDKWMLIDGMVVERKAHAIAMAIKQYDPELELICLDPTNPDIKITSAPFMVVAPRHDGSYYKVLEAWELDDRILQRLWTSDKYHNNSLELLEKMEAKIRKENEDRYREYIEPKKELAVSVWKNPKTQYTYHNDEGDLVTINDHGPATVNKNKKSFTMEVPDVGK